MTQKDFEFIASTIRALSFTMEPLPWQQMTNRFTSELARANPRFDEGRFRKACESGPSR